MDKSRAVRHTLMWSSELLKAVERLDRMAERCNARGCTETVKGLRRLICGNKVRAYIVLLHDSGIKIR